MSQYPFEQAGGLVVGTVDFVSPDEIKVALDTEAPESMALNPGTPRPFPRVNGYLLVAVDDGFLVGQVEWLTVERSPFPTRRGFRDFGLVDLPYPLRRLRLNPLGVLNAHVDGGFSFKRGIQRSPTIGASVLLPTDAQLRSVIESGDRRRVRIGTNPMASNAEVCVDPDRLFGRHLAVLGNTGSGKSCTVAGLIRWSLEAAERRNRDLLHMENGKTKDLLQRPHARFVILDPNGEYSRAFASNDPIVAARIFKVGGPTGDGVAALKVPIWFWNSSEWGSFARASPRTQQPLLRRALREVKVGRTGV